ncbi:MAG: rubrerythrin family protein [Bacilli bacterium]|nr:rubrerythrin family protein [Bacilli bacterium]
MKKSLKNTKTEKNLLEAFLGESQARNKYSFFASQAKKDGLLSIAEDFLKIADNEKVHAKIWFKYLNDLSNTTANIESAINGEHYEWSQMYKEFAKTAREEGFPEIADKFDFVGNIEKSHEEYFSKILNKVKNNSVFTCDNDNAIWICAKCGHIHIGKNAPDVCPVCGHKKNYFKKNCCLKK